MLDFRKNRNGISKYIYTFKNIKPMIFTSNARRQHWQMFESFIIAFTNTEAFNNKYFFWAELTQKLLCSHCNYHVKWYLINVLMCPFWYSYKIKRTSKKVQNEREGERERERDTYGLTVNEFCNCRIAKIRMNVQSVQDLALKDWVSIIFWLK